MVQSAGLDPAADYALNEIPTWTQPLRMLTLEGNWRLQSSSQLGPFSFFTVWTTMSAKVVANHEVERSRSGATTPVVN